MARKKREPYIPGACYHIYNRGNRKLPVYFTPRDKRFFVRKLGILLRPKKCDVELLACCLMENHYHLILREGEHYSIGRLMRRFLTAYGVYFNRRNSLVGQVFQGRYQSRRVRGPEDLRQLIRYIWLNPVRAGYVENPSNYAWMYVKKGYEPEGPTLRAPDPSR